MRIREVKDRVKYAYQRARYGCDESASWEIEYSMLRYLLKCLDYYLDKGTEVIEDEIIKYKNIKESKNLLMCAFYNDLAEYIGEYWDYEDEKKHKMLRKELEDMWKALRDYLSW